MAGWNMQIQKNAIGGYSFLLPEYKRFITGAFWLTTFRLDNQLSVTGGIRYDRGRIDITAFEDPYLVEYLHRQGYEEERPMCKGRYQPGVCHQNGPQWACHHGDPPEDLHCAGLRC